MANLSDMNRLSHLVAIALSSLLVLAMAVPALATESESEPEPETTETTLAPAPVFENGEPAVVIPPVEVEPEEQPWTSRFIYPALVAATILLLVLIVVLYNRNIRRKYEVVPE